jgi:fibronectin-binding autotransporter adhesin
MKSNLGRILLGFIGCLLLGASAQAANFTAATDGNWAAAATWTFSGTDADGIPDADDAVTISSSRTVTVTGAQSFHTLNVTSIATLTLSAGATLTTDGTAGSSFTSNGTVNGAGTLRTQGTTALSITGTFTAPLEIAGGTTSGGSTIGGSLTVLSGATLNSTNQTFTVGGDLNVNAGGAIIHNFATFRVNGANIIINGAISGGAFTFGGSGTQNLSGAGTLTDSITVLGASVTTLTSGVTLGNGATATTLAINTNGVLATNGNTLTLNSVDISGAGSINGAGLVRMQGVSTINVNSNFTAPFEINSGTTSGAGTLGGSLAVASGATLDTINQSFTVNGDLTNNGTITKSSGTFRANSQNIVNNGAISGGAFVFGGSGTQNLSGAGALTAAVTILGGSTTTLTSDVTIGNGVAATTLAVNTNGTLAVGNSKLTLNGVAVSGAGAFTSNVGGIIQTLGTSSLSVGASFSGSLEVAGGTTTASGTVGGALTVSSGATLNTGNASFTVSGDLTNNGTITKTSGTFTANGVNIVNNGTITGGSFVFGGAAQIFSGSGSVSAVTTISGGTTVTLASNHQLSTLSVNTNGTLNTSTFTLFLNGAGTPLSGAGTIANVNVTYNGAAAQTVQTAASYNRLGIDNATGVTLSSAETVNQRLVLTSGAFNNGAFLTIANGATIERASGTLQAAPTLGGSLSVEYTGAIDVITGVEFPASVSAVINLIINKTATTNTVTLDASRTVNGALILTNGRLITTGSFTISVAAGGTSTGSDSGFVIGTIQKGFAGPALFVFHVGTATGYSPSTINVDSGAGTFSVSSSNGVIGGLDPAKTLDRFWSLVQTGITQADITFQYQDSDVPPTAFETQFRFARNDGASNTFFTPSSLNRVTNTFTLNNVTQFSDWTLHDLGPTAASVSVAGRVYDRSNGVSKATVILTDSSGNTRLALTNPFGYFSFENVGVGQTYIVTISSKQYQFSPQILNITEEVSNLNFMPISK